MEQKLSTNPQSRSSSTPFRPEFRANLCTEDYAYLRQRAVFRSVRGQREIFSKQTFDTLLLVESGVVRLTVTCANGRRLLIRCCQPGAVFSQDEAGGSDISAVADQDCTLLQFTTARFAEALAERPRFALHVALQSRLAIGETTRNFTELAGGTLRSRVVAALLRLAQDTEPPVVIRPAPSHAELAQAVGATREAVTRQLGQLGFDGVIATKRREIILLDPNRLRLAASPDRPFLRGALHVGC